MFYIIDQPPNYCPNCGKDLRPIWRDRANLLDFHEHASHSCACGARFQLVTTALIIDTAQAEGDLSNE